MQEVALADDADQSAGSIDNGNPADGLLGKELCHGLDRRARIDRNHIRRHDIHRAHCNASERVFRRIRDKRRGCVDVDQSLAGAAPSDT